MLDGILGRGFSAKCKSLIKLTRSRIDVIRRKRTATQKFLKKDIADLLSNGLDVNAYGRAEGLLIELRLTSCYDFVDQCCEFLLKHLSSMQKQSDCPEQCREAVCSMMFAAARFSDLPELRDLRQTFQERYGDSLEYCLNKEFAEKLSAKPCTMEKKVELMQAIAVEFSIKWNASNFEQRMSKSSATEQAQTKNGGFLYTFDDKCKVSNDKETSSRGEKTDPSLQDAASNGHKFHKNIEVNGWKRNELEIHNEQPQLLSNVRRVQSEKEVLITRKEMDFTSDRRLRESPSLKPVGSSGSSHRKFDEYGDGGVKPDKLKEKHVVENSSASVSRDEARFLAMKPPKSEVQATPFDKLKEKHVVENTPPASVSRDEVRFLAMKPPKIEVQATTPFDSSYAKVKIEEDSRRKACNYAIPPPYVKPNVRKEVIQDVAGPTLDKVSENVEKMENLPRTKSHRRRHSRRSNHGDDDHHHEEEENKRTSRRREDPRKGLQILFDDDRRHKDEEERIIDKLLIHYSKKPSFDEEEARSRRKSRTRRVNEGLGELERRGSRLKDEEFEGLPPPLPRRVNAGPREPERRGSQPKEEEFKVLPLPPRSISLPKEQPSAPAEAVKVYSRAASFQPDGSDEARHVHPKLPDYDDLAARFAALKGR